MAPSSGSGVPFSTWQRVRTIGHRQGNAGQAQALADDLCKRFPEDTVVQFNYLPTLRVKVAQLRPNPRQALKALRVAAPYELGLPAIEYYNWPNLYPVYVLGEAYLAARQGKEAAAEFQKIDHRGIVLNEPSGALAHLQLGRAYAMQGDTAKSRAAYQDFLALWKDADCDISILKEAKGEFAKLKKSALLPSPPNNQPFWPTNHRRMKTPQCSRTD